LRRFRRFSGFRRFRRLSRFRRFRRFNVRSILLGSSLIRTHFERVVFSAQEQR
jgi:hypothetical protein